jgi:hypothetical protein
VTAREEAAVNEWLESDASLHSMRDHPYHNVPLVGGGWGARLTEDTEREQWENVWEEILGDPDTYAVKDQKGQDQDILTNHVWKSWIGDIFQHDSYMCEGNPGSIGFPTQRKKESHNFILALGPEPLWEKCPVPCRRQKDWEYC